MTIISNTIGNALNKATWYLKKARTKLLTYDLWDFQHDQNILLPETWIEIPNLKY